MSKQPKGVRYGGRTKGTPNKTTAFCKQTIQNLLDTYQQSGLMSQDFMALEPKERMMIGERLINYLMPKMQAVAVSNENEKPLTIESRLRQLAEDNDN